MPWGGEMSIFSPEATGNRTECTHSCTQIQAARLQSRKLTSLAMQGANALTDLAPQICATAKPRTWCFRVDHAREGLQSAGRPFTWWRRFQDRAGQRASIECLLRRT